MRPLLVVLVVQVGMSIFWIVAVAEVVAKLTHLAFDSRTHALALRCNLGDIEKARSKPLIGFYFDRGRRVRRRIDPVKDFVSASEQGRGLAETRIRRCA